MSLKYEPVSVEIDQGRWQFRMSEVPQYQQRGTPVGLRSLWPQGHLVDGRKHGLEGEFRWVARIDRRDERVHQSFQHL